MITTAIILAAGRGSRLNEVTATRSKAMAPIAGVPMIGRVMESLRGAGLSRFVIVAAPTDAELRAHYAEQPSVTVLTQLEPRGSGDALRVAANLAPEHFVVCACDSLVRSSHIQALVRDHVSSGAAITMSVMEVAPEVSLSARSVVDLVDGRVRDLIEKPSPEQRISNVSALPLYAMSRGIFDEIDSIPLSPRGEYELPEAFRSIIRKGGEVRAVYAQERFDLTTPSDFVDMNERFLAQLSPAIQVDPSVTLPSSTTLIPPVLMERGVQVGERVTLGPSVYLEQGSAVAAGCRLERVVITRGAIARSDAQGVVITES